MIKRKEGCLMKKILYGALTGFALFLVAGCTPKTPTAVSSTNEQKETVISTSETSSSVQQEATTTSEKTSAVAVSLEKVTTAFEKKYPEAKITSLQLDTDFGRYFYEIEGVDQQKEYQVEVNAETGEFTKEKVETLDADEQNGVKMQEEALDLTKIISREQATTLAEKAAKVGQATDWKLEKELGITYWEVKVKEGQQKIEVKIDAHSGKILTTERDD
ncbi:peptidase propeptide and YPEB domain protein [Enterococcus faecalis]|uniref:PepSY domain-containing protein n=1 Tax=Enterococcus faecalis TaxID=1351 RepID=UPI00046C6430|nr:PepSY domain-containing protein [Enterococcus faecalis]EGO2728179.1 peptidase propeptide and YPEB domain protein [Enterococcus faecalis]EGO2808428.1 peptidase propeptide and YPEB domain protein [Enterococcus faecalis]EGO5022720.1 peptidase propeptide and YPEB domain protein [Enterococcus faecalis]EGO6647595.1 peptidase propeptide and YPEB domain protein [Enterococcus faecalis]EGO7661665.1 peptidase propeptide and YPEB domain protein [Enterococcus faecalis]